MSFSSLPLSQNPRFISPVPRRVLRDTSLTVIRASQQSFLRKLARIIPSFFSPLVTFFTSPRLRLSHISSRYHIRTFRLLFIPSSVSSRTPTQLSCLLPILAFSLSLSRSLSCAHTHTRHRTTSLITTYFNTIRRRVTPTIEGITINA